MPESAAHRFHRLTSYSPDRHWLVPAEGADIRQDFLPLDEASRPAGQKVYPANLPRMPLPTPVRSGGDLGGETLSGGRPGADQVGPFDLAELSWLLHWSAGIMRRRVSRSGQPEWFRAASSAGNRQPIEVYLQARGVIGLPDGVWHYGPAAHELIRVGPPTADGVAIILTGIPWRTQWKYAERGYRHIWWDAGSLTAHLDLLTRAAGRRARIRLDFPDADIAAAVGADERAELPLTVVEVGGQIGWHRPEHAAVAGDLGTGGWDFPLVRSTHEAGRLDSWGSGQARDVGAQVQPIDIPADVIRLSTDQMISRRSTSRKFTAAAVPGGAAIWPPSVAVRPLDTDGGDVLPVVRVFVHRVAGLKPGCYDFSSGGLHVLYLGDTRSDARLCCVDQAAAHDCAYLVLLAAELESALERRGERGYRDLQLFAGLAASRCQLAATALGLGSTPLTVCDEAAARFTPPGTIPLLAIAVGNSPGQA